MKRLLVALSAMLLMSGAASAGEQAVWLNAQFTFGGGQSGADAGLTLVPEHMPVSADWNTAALVSWSSLAGQSSHWTVLGQPLTTQHAALTAQADDPSWGEQYGWTIAVGVAATVGIVAWLLDEMFESAGDAIGEGVEDSFDGDEDDEPDDDECGVVTLDPACSP